MDPGRGGAGPRHTTTPAEAGRRRPGTQAWCSPLFLSARALLMAGLLDLANRAALVGLLLQL